MLASAVMTTNIQIQTFSQGQQHNICWCVFKTLWDKKDKVTIEQKLTDMEDVGHQSIVEDRT